MARRRDRAIFGARWQASFARSGFFDSHLLPGMGAEGDIGGVDVDDGEEPAQSRRDRARYR